MQDIYSAVLIIIFAPVIAAAVGAFVLYIIRDQARYRKEKICEMLTEIGATEINIYRIEEIVDWPGRFGQHIYHVEYKDAQGTRRKTEFLVSNVTSDIKWKSKH